MWPRHSYHPECLGMATFATFVFSYKKCFYEMIVGMVYYEYSAAVIIDPMVSVAGKKRQDLYGPYQKRIYRVDSYAQSLKTSFRERYLKLAGAGINS